MTKNQQVQASSELSPDREFAMRLGSVILRILHRSSGDAFGPIYRSGLSFGQAKTLLLLAAEDSEQPLTVGEAAELLGVSMSCASRSVDGLAGAGLVERSEDPEDRRVRRLRLTPAGEDLALGFLSARLDGIEEFTSTLDAEERRALDSALAVLLKREEMAETYQRNLRRERSR